MIEVLDKQTIKMTRGDTFRATLEIEQADGTPYTPASGDEIRFAMKKNYEDQECLIEKEIPINTLVLEISPAETKDLSFGKYVYDIQLTHENGDVDTFIDRAELFLTEEVD